MIDSKNILQTDLLDLLFDGRNKQYGAYELRTKYNKRMVVAVTIMIACCLLLFFFFAFASGRDHSRKLILGPDIVLDVVPEIKEPEVIPPPPKPKLPEIKTVQFTTPKITEDPLKPDEQLPDMDVLEETKIGKINQEGDKDLGIVAPPIGGNGTGVIDLLKKHDADDDSIVLFVQLESEYAGGIEAWKRYLGKNLRYPPTAMENDIQGTVLIQFIVDKEGVVSNVEAISGPNELRDEAVRVIKKSGQWKPAIQNGRQVKSYKRQPIIFLLQQ